MREDLVWELEQRRQITETLLDYCEFIDRNDPDSVATNVFAEDGVFELGSQRAVVGRDNLAKMFAKTLAVFSATSHHLSNVHISLEGAEAATASAYVYAWHLTLAGDRVEAWARYHDKLVLQPEGWRISSRHLSMAGTAGWDTVPFESINRKPNPVNPPSSS